MNMNAIKTDGRQVKLLAAIAVVALVVCALVAAIPSVNAADDADYGSSVDMDQDTFNGLINGGVISIDANTTWKLTENIVASNVSIQLSANLKITSSADDNYSIRITYSGAGVAGEEVKAAAIGVPSSKTVSLAIENTTMVVNNSVSVPSWTINSAEATKFTVNVVNSDLTVSKTGEYVADTGAVWKTGNGNTVINSDKDSVLTFTSTGQGIQSLLIKADGTEINNDLRDGTLAIYADFKDVSLSGGNIGLYAAKLVNSSIETSGTLGVYSGTKENAFSSDFADGTANQVSVDASSFIEAGSILNDLSEAGSNAGSDAVVFTGNGTVSGSFANVDADGSAKYTLSGITLKGNNSVSSGVTMEGTYTVASGASLNVAKGATVQGTVTNNGTIDAEDASSISGLKLAAGGTGTIINGGGSAQATLGGIVNPTDNGTKFGPTQVVEVVSDLRITSGAVVVIQGTLHVPSGTTVTIEDGGQLVLTGVGATIENEGTIISQSGAKNISGLSYDGGLVIDANTIVNNTGSISAQYVGDTSGLTIIRVLGTVNNDGEFAVDAGDNNNVRHQRRHQQQRWRFRRHQRNRQHR